MKRPAFTLIEVLVTLVIVSMLAAAIYGMFLKSVVDARAVQDVEGAERTGQAVLALIERDIKGCVRPDEDFETFTGSVTTADTGLLEIFTTSDSHTLQEDMVSDVTRVTYAASGGGEGLYALFRSEEYGSDGEKTRRLLDDRVKKFDLEYYDGSGWRKDWSGDELPLAVRVKVVLSRSVQWTVSGGKKDEEFAFSALVPVPTAE